MTTNSLLFLVPRLDWFCAFVDSTMPFDRLTALSGVEALTTLSFVEGLGTVWFDRLTILSACLPAGRKSKV